MTGAPFYSSFGAFLERENDELGIAFIMQGSQFRGLQGYFGLFWAIRGENYLFC